MDSLEINEDNFDQNLEGLFPFQTFIKIVEDPNCSVQKKLSKCGLKKLNIQSHNEVVTQMNSDLLNLSTQKSQRALIKKSKLKNKLSFLEKVEPLVRNYSRKYFDPRTTDFFKKKNVNVLYYVKDKSEVETIKNLQRHCSIYFYPNTLDVEEKEVMWNTGKRTRLVSRYSSSKNLILSQLNFVFIDIDDFGSIEKLNDVIDSFGLPPDVVVQSSEDSFHLYWSITPLILDVTTEDFNGRQLDLNKINYELVIKQIIHFFDADRRRADATGKMRMPGTWNVKPLKNKEYLCDYTSGSRTLQDGLKDPQYTITQIVNHVQNKMNVSINASAQKEYDERVIRLPILTDTESSKPIEEEDLLQHQAEVFKKAEFDFEVGWEDSLKNFCDYYGITTKEFDFNDRIIFKHIWKNRLREVLNFPEPVRLSLKGTGLKYTEMNRSIIKISRLSKTKDKKSFSTLFKVAEHKRGTKFKKGLLTGYKISPDFLNACGSAKTEPINWKKKIHSKLYEKGNRNKSIPYDCYILKEKLGYSFEDSLAFLTEKVKRSSEQPDISLQCSGDTSNLVAWLRYYYK